MTSVTIICATRNARDAAQLTFLSLRRFTREPYQVLVADNGSTDGTLEMLQSISWLRVYAFHQRPHPAEWSIGEMCIPGENAQDRNNVMRVPTLFKGNQPGFPSAEYMHTDDNDTSNGAALDWLAEQVQTPFFVTLDSDMEFLAADWLSSLLEFAERDRVDAIGEYEPGFGTYRPRLRPHLLLVRTSVFRDLAASFRAFEISSSLEEMRSWANLRKEMLLDAGEQSQYKNIRIYDNGAYLLESFMRHNALWASTPRQLRTRYRHYGHMSWGDDLDPSKPQGKKLLGLYQETYNQIINRLSFYLST